LEILKMKSFLNPDLCSPIARVSIYCKFPTVDGLSQYAGLTVFSVAL
jgi:hypothetical protein